MGEEKLKKIVSAATVAAVLLAVILCLIILYQMITISAYKRKKQRLIAEIESLRVKIEQTEDEIERNSTILYLEQRAREYGFIYSDDKVYQR